MLIEVQPQVLGASGLLLARPAWCSEIMVVFDTTYINGAIFCWVCSPVMRRVDLLAAAGLPADPSIEVYVPSRALPLDDDDECQMEIGHCISFVPASCPHFIVSSLSDMLQSVDGWSVQAPIPAFEGRWVCTLTDGEPCCFPSPIERRRFLRNEIAQQLGAWTASLFLQPARPPVTDFAEGGCNAAEVIIATQNHPSRDGCLYFLDLRPLLCGLTWAVSEDGLVSVRLIRQQCARRACPGWCVRVVGGAPAGDDQVAVVPGDVLTVYLVEESAPPADSAITSAERDSDARLSHGAPPDAPPQVDKATTRADLPVSSTPPEGSTSRTVCTSEATQLCWTHQESLTAALSISRLMLESFGGLAQLFAYADLAARWALRSRLHAFAEGCAVHTFGAAELPATVLASNSPGRLNYSGHPLDHVPSSRQQKLLSEPTDRSGGGYGSTGDLQHITVQLGGHWP